MSESPVTPLFPPLDTHTLQDQLLDIQDEAKKNKVQLTPEVEQYIREHFEAVQQKLANGEQVYDEDLAFIKDVRLWVSIPDNVRGKFPSIEVLKKSGELEEAAKRHISPKQWLDLLHLAEAKNKDKIWIEESFRFPGGGRIKTNRDIDCGDLDIMNCPSLTFLPEGLEITGNLYIGPETPITALPSGLRITNGGMKIWSTSLTSLPADLEVNQSIDLSIDVHEQVKKDAKRLKREGRVKGRITYF